MKAKKKILSAIRELGKADKFEVYLGKVKAVNEGQTTCDVDIETDVTIFDVRLRAVVTDNKGMWVLPKVNSFVVIAQVEGGTDFVLLSASEVDKVFIVIGSTTLEVNANQIKVNNDKLVIQGDQFTVNGGNNNGLVKVAALKTKLNNLENKLNSLLTAYNAHVHTVSVATTCGAGAGTGSGSATSTPSTVAGSLTLTQQADLENTKFKH